MSTGILVSDHCDRSAFLPGRATFIKQTISEAGKYKRVVHVQDFHVAVIVRIAFYLFIATIPFETVDLGINVEPTAATLGFLFLSLVFQPTLILRRPPMAFWLFFLYTAIFATILFLSTPKIFFDEALWQLFVLLQLVVMGWVAFNIFKSEGAARNALITLAISCAVLSLLQQIGFGNRNVDTSSSFERATAFGFHPNNLARILGIGFLALAGLTYATKKSIFKSRLWVWALLALIGITVVQTGSRGGLFALLAGLVVFVLKQGAVSIRVRNLAIVVIGLIFISVLVFQSEMNTVRLERAIEEGDFARREQIYPTAARMFLQKPIFGWGPKTGEYELGARLAHSEEDSKNAHNLILFALIATGLLGSIPLAVGLAITLITAWKTRFGIRGVLPLSMVVMVLIANMSGVWLHNKLHWFVMAYALSCPFVSRRLQMGGRLLRLHALNYPAAAKGK